MKTNNNRLVWLFTVVCAFSVANLYYAQPILNIISKDVGIDPLKTSLIIMLTQLGYALGIIFITPLADIVEKRKMILATLPLSIISILVFAFSKSVGLLLLSSLFIGFFSVTQQLIIPFAAQISSPEIRGYNIGKITSGLLIGILLSRTFSGVVGAVIGWRFVYILSACFLITMEILLFMWLPKLKKPSKTSYYEVISSLPKVLKNNPTLQEASLNGTLMFFCFNLVWSMLVFYLSDIYGFGEIVAGLLGLAGLAGAVIAPIIGKKVRVKGYRKIIFQGMICTSIAFIILLIIRNDMIGLIISLILLDLGVQTALVTNQSRIHNIENEFRSRANAVFVFFYFLGGSLGTVLGVYLYKHYGITLVSLTGILIIIIAYIIQKIYSLKYNE